MDDSIQELHARIQALRQAAEGLAAAGEEIPAVSCNTARILASCRMMELDISDLFEPGVLENRPE